MESKQCALFYGHWNCQVFTNRDIQSKQKAFTATSNMLCKGIKRLFTSRRIARSDQELLIYP